MTYNEDHNASVSTPSRRKRRPSELSDMLDSTTGSIDGGNSPRSLIAARLHDLHIRRRTSSPEPSLLCPRKRARMESPLIDIKSEPKHGDILRMPCPKQDRLMPVTGPNAERADSEKNLSQLANVFEFRSSSPIPFRSRRYNTPPPPKCASPPIDTPMQNDMIVLASYEAEAPRSPLSEKHFERSDPRDLDQAALTWQASEITGHEIDSKYPEDDGEGINGIGFRPTPAMAYVRSQKRRQQISDWKAREAKEARRKRIERRRKASTEDVVSQAQARGRTVRFMIRSDNDPEINELR